MFESFFLVSAQKFEIMEVTTTGREEPKPFLGSDKESLFLPDEMNAFFLDYTTYYYMGGLHLPGIIILMIRFKLLCMFRRLH